MYFSKFPTILYAPNVDVNSARVATDVTKRVVMSRMLRDNAVFFEDYIINDGETPELVAYKYYGNQYLHWIVLLANMVADIKSDGPMRETVFEKYIDDKYGDTKYDIKYWQTPSGLVVDNTYNDVKYQVTNYDYEQELNNNKRVIKLIKPALLDTFIKQFESEMNV